MEHHNRRYGITHLAGTIPGASAEAVAVAGGILAGRIDPNDIPLGSPIRHELACIFTQPDNPSQEDPVQHEPSRINQQNPLVLPSQGGQAQNDPFRVNPQNENLPPGNTNRRLRYNATSNTWTSSSGESLETDGIGDRSLYVGEFNKIAQQHGIPKLIPDSHEPPQIDTVVLTGKAGSSIMKRFLSRTTSLLSLNKSKPDPKPDLKHKRSISDISLRMVGVKKDTIKDKHLAEIVTLCGLSPFYLPNEYALGTLSLPTCFRATAQYLVQHGPAMKGIFRIPGSQSIVKALYDHYASQDEDGDVISDTVRCPYLPDSIKCDAHDVASTFKRFLLNLPGGILGKVWLFDAFVAIHDQMGVDPEYPRTKQSKVRARLIACAIYAHPSRLQRDLICAVFGLLCLIGRASEVALREDVDGRPLPTNELMGYSPLGTLFGPLLVGGLIDECNTRRGDVTVETSQEQTLLKMKSRHRKPKIGEGSLLETNAASGKLRVANSVAEMVITHWRDVVKQMVKLNSKFGPLLVAQHLQERGKGKHPRLPKSASEYALRPPPYLNPVDRYQSGGLRERSGSPTPPPRGQYNQRNVNTTSSDTMFFGIPQKVQDLLRERSRPKAQPSRKLSGSKSMSVLTAPRKGDDKIEYEKLRGAYGVAKATKEEIISTGHPSYSPHQGLPEASSENTAPLQLRVTPTNPLLDEPLIENGDLDVTQTATVGGDNITNTTTSEQSQDERSTENSEITEINKETGHKDDVMQLKKKQPIARQGNPKVSKNSKFSSTNQQSDVEDDLPPRISRIPGLSPSEHLKKRQIDQAHIAARGSSNDILAKSQQSDADSDLPPRVSRIPGQSPSEHLERMLSANIPESVRRHTTAYESTGSAFGSGGSSHLAGQPRRSLMMSEVESGSGLVRLSHEQDMASLASLAQVLKSESNSEFQSFDPSSNTTEFATDDGGINDTPTNSSTHNRTAESESAMSKKSTHSANNSAKRVPFAAPVNQVASVKNTAGIKSLIGKFNSVDQDATRSAFASPTLSPATVGGRYSVQFPVTAPSAYAINYPSPILSRSALESSRDFGNEASQQSIYMEVASPRSLPPTRIPRPVSASLLSITHQAETQLTFMPLEPTEKHTGHGSSYMDGGYNSIPVQPSLGLLQDGGGNENLGTPGRSSRDKMHSRLATEITIWEDPNTHSTSEPRSTSAFSENPQPSVDPRSSNSCIRVGPLATTQAPISPAVGTGAQGKSNSVLFAQITNLQRMLVTRTEEADNLRKQLATKGSLNDLSTLAEQLREAKRDTAMWQARAAMAERHIERLSQFNPATISEAMGEDSAYFGVDATRLTGMHEYPVVGRRGFHAQDVVGPAQHANVDGARSSADSTGTQGTTIMRTIPELRELSDESGDDDESVASYGTFGRKPRKSKESSGEDLITFSETD
ncbi:hypothetical protein V496_01898 [Pseudogymnoascus sp. VKM F-4515 (FW-2607)]|nr:hypothetical protein V496_01898 [Pseudogymnoascus sp. VKM F-4515 (FW-2607)]